MACGLTSLPPEVIRRIWLSMSPTTQVAFISTCKSLYNGHSLDVVCARLKEFALGEEPVLLALASHGTLVRRCVEYGTYPGNDASNDDIDDASDAIMEPGSSKYKLSVHEDWVLDPKNLPQHDLTHLFVVVSANLSPARDDIELRVAFPEYHENSEDAVEVLPEGPNVFISRDFVEKVVQSQTSSEGEEIIHGPFSYNEAMQTGCIFQVINSSAVLRRWWMHNCYECGGSRTICPGCGGVGVRWSEAFASCGYDMPCPMCVGYDSAIEAKYLVRDDDQRAIDEDYNVACVTVQRWSAREWAARVETETDVVAE